MHHSIVWWNLRPLIVLFLYKFVVLGALDGVDEHSPLDDDNPYIYPSSAERRKQQMPYVVETQDTISKLFPQDCTSQCNSHLFETLKSALEGSTSHVFKNFEAMCKNYDDTKRCLHDIRYCKTSNLYDALTSGLRYMCDYQRNAIEAMLPCVNEVFPSIQTACERSCQTDRIAAGLTMKTMFQEDIKILKMLDQHMGRLSTNEACRVSQCMLKCYRTRMNVRCEGAAGSILTEGLVRPYSEFQALGGSIITPLMSMIVPRQCGFMTNPKELAEFRIDPFFDEHVHKKYDELRKSMDNYKPPPFHDPFQNVTLDSELSPLDSD